MKIYRSKGKKVAKGIVKVISVPMKQGSVKILRDQEKKNYRKRLTLEFITQAK